MSYHWNTNTVEAESSWTVAGVTANSTITSTAVATTSTWVTDKIDVASTWSVTDPMISVDTWGILEAVPIYFSDNRLWNELRIIWGI